MRRIRDCRIISEEEKECVMSQWRKGGEKGKGRKEVREQK